MKKKYAFTLIEIMIAIVVFAIGVLAVLRVLTWDLSLMDHTDMKLQSTVFWKEWLELLYNVRDSNFEKELPWNCIMKPEIFWLQTNALNIMMMQESIANPNFNMNEIICSWYFWSDQIIQLWFDKNHYMTQNITWKSDNFETLFKDNQLCLFTWEVWWNTGMFWYSYCLQDGVWEPTFFARYLSFTWIDVGGELLLTEKIMKVESHVLYKKWHKTWEFVFESFIWNY